MNAQPIKIGITGASGFVGKNLCNQLVKSGFDVVAVVRDESKCRLPDNVQVRVAPSYEDWEKFDVLEGCEVVIHLVGRAHVMDDDSLDPINEHRKVNVRTIDSLIDSARKAKTRRVVFVSTIGVNGMRTSGAAFSELNEARPHDAYSISKLEAEERLKIKAKNAQIEYVIVRPSLVFGPDAPGNFKTLLELAAKNIPLPFKAFQAQRNIVSIWNLVAFLEICSVHSAAANETFLIADEQAVDLPRIFIELRKGMGKKPKIFFIPISIFRIGTYLFPKRRHQFAKLNSELLVDSHKAKNLLGWRPIFSTSQGLQKVGKEYCSGN